MAGRGGGVGGAPPPRSAWRQANPLSPTMQHIRTYFPTEFHLGAGRPHRRLANRRLYTGFFDAGGRRPAYAPSVHSGAGSARERPASAVSVRALCRRRAASAGRLNRAARREARVGSASRPGASAIRPYRGDPRDRQQPDLRRRAVLPLIAAARARPQRLRGLEVGIGRHRSGERRPRDRQRVRRGQRAPRGRCGEERRGRVTVAVRHHEPRPAPARHAGRPRQGARRPQLRGRRRAVARRPGGARRGPRRARAVGAAARRGDARRGQGARRR